MFIIIGGIIAGAIIVLVVVLICVGIWSHRQHLKVHAKKGQEHGPETDVEARGGVEAPAPADIENEAKFVMPEPKKERKAEPASDLAVESFHAGGGDEEDSYAPRTDDDDEEEEDKPKKKKKKSKGKKKKKQDEDETLEIEEA